MSNKNLEKRKEYNRKYYKEYYKKNKEKISIRMKKYNKLYQKKHKKYYKKYYKEHYIPHPKQIKYDGKNYQREYMREKRIIALRILGNKCCKCGFDDYRALQIDHINGNGHIERKKIANSRIYYIKVINSVKNNLNEYQLLCANCNWIKKVENNEIRKFKIDK